MYWPCTCVRTYVRMDNVRIRFISSVHIACMYIACMYIKCIYIACMYTYMYNNNNNNNNIIVCYHTSVARASASRQLANRVASYS